MAAREPRGKVRGSPRTTCSRRFPPGQAAAGSPPKHGRAGAASDVGLAARKPRLRALPGAEPSFPPAPIPCSPARVSMGADGGASVAERRCCRWVPSWGGPGFRPAADRAMWIAAPAPLPAWQSLRAGVARVLPRIPRGQSQAAAGMSKLEREPSRQGGRAPPPRPVKTALGAAPSRHPASLALGRHSPPWALGFPLLRDVGRHGRGACRWHVAPANLHGEAGGWLRPWRGVPVAGCAPCRPRILPHVVRLPGVCRRAVPWLTGVACVPPSWVLQAWPAGLSAGQAVVPAVPLWVERRRRRPRPGCLPPACGTS